MYDKRQRIVHNQFFILILAIIANIIVFPVSPALFFLAIKFMPVVSVPLLGDISLLWILWFIGFVMINCVDGCILYNRWKSKHGYDEETDFNQQSRRKQEHHVEDKGIY